MRRMFLFDSTPALSKAVALSGLLAALIAAPAAADDLADVSKLIGKGQFNEALAKADAFLSKYPRDAQMRFMKGVVLTEQNKSAEAISVFSKLTEDHPNLPEPHNNLAVLYASSGQYEKARAALNAAIQTNPSYATAYENLGDVHAKLASQAYDKALQFDSGNATAKSKLTLVRSLVSATNTSTGAKPVTPTPASAPAPVPTSASAPAPKIVAKDTAVTAAPPVKPVPPPLPKVAKVEPKAELRAVPKAQSGQEAGKSERDAVLKVVSSWAKAWSDQDVKSYLDFYAGTFQVPGGQTRKKWEAGRRARIDGKGRISVKVHAPEVTVNGDTATVRFRQEYVSDLLTANTRKTLVLTKQASTWRIRQESTGR